MKIPRQGTWVDSLGLDHTLYQKDITEVCFTGCGLFPYHDSAGHVLKSFMMPTCVACVIAPHPERTPR